MWSIRQTDEGWEVLDADGHRVGDSHETYDQALAVIADLARDQVAARDDTLAEGDGLLPEVWESVDGIAFSEATGDGRDFTDCEWSWRDPGVSMLPLMLQQETEIGHFGAQLAGYIESIGEDGSAIVARGRFYDSETGRALRDMLLDDRRFGVSVDPGRADAEFECTETDDEGFCIDGVLQFTAYEIIGVTGTPFPAFERAAIRLATTAVADDADEGDGDDTDAGDEDADAEGEDAVAASAAVTVGDEPVRVPSRPPVEWFANPALAEPTPLTIDPLGHVYGHLAAWGTCHVGSERVCLVPPSTACGYERFLIGEVTTDAGTAVPTGALTWGIEHADLSLSMIEAQAHYANSRHGWADVTAGEDDHGIWIAGALRPGLNDADLRVLRALALSGDWRHDARHRNLELVAALAVNVPGFPIPRSVVASGRTIGQPRPAAHVGDGSVQTALVASGLVVPEALANRRPTEGGCGCGSGERLARIETMLGRLDRRTRHLNSDGASALAARIHRTNDLLDQQGVAATDRLVARMND